MMSRRLLILSIAIIEGLVIYSAGFVWLAASGGDFQSDFFDVLVTPEAHLVVGVWTACIILAQFALLLPVRRPFSTSEAGTSLKLSLLTAALAIALLTCAGIWALIELMRLWENFLDLPGAGWMLLGMIGLAWALTTPLLYAFCRKARRDTLIARLSTRLFLGTMIETLAIIPLDVMVRKRTDCYCGSGSFLALTTTGTVGLFAMGPAIFAPFIARRRKRWWQSRCEACNYNMSGNLDADRCPECGAGWRAAD
jgi:hypothetical protein